MEEKIKQILINFAHKVKHDESWHVDWEAAAIRRVLLQNQKFDKEYKDGKSAGDIALQYKVVVGEIGCPHCGITVSGGLISPICGWCDKNMFE